MDEDVSEHDPLPADEEAASGSQGPRSINHITSIITGTGYTIYDDLIIPEILAAKHEVVLVTCFWASSVTQKALANCLRALSRKAASGSAKVSVNICFSSSSLPRNMLWPTPQRGQIYDPSTWTKLGLPQANELHGIDLRVCRKFFWPLGIIHSKYVIIDRKVAIFPSCNVSWERWFEFAVKTQGPIVDSLLSFHVDFWGDDHQLIQLSAVSSLQQDESRSSSTTEGIRAFTTLLPSPHTPTLIPKHLKLPSMMGRLPCVPDAPTRFPETALLATTYRLLHQATNSIIMLTPNLTEPAVLDALSCALERGVNLIIWTNSTLMTMEQIVTAGTTTPRCIRALQKKAEAFRGVLEVNYFDQGPGKEPVLDSDKETTPIKLHSKVTIIDADKILVGSGNMDAASWGTSQELGVLIESGSVVREFLRSWRYGNISLCPV
ncbi:hypothetical protein PV10_02705 [Exophiala mesophila]|uniref:PLD phosphodiesterase domain-containing protein n=1 Tax=Exophiala mesophila TaxID=212818 RepID=A0A0D1Y361_EXOME|nr:uncharacterized protein PV10_02705 [Exophiala mesophila]KIV94996.1 hypothetical protein PV10_02705 [Exophiala mesophila]